MRRLGRWAVRFGPPVVVLLAILFLWHFIVRAGDIPPYVLPTPLEVMERVPAVEDLGFHLRITMTEAGIGFALSLVLGVILAGFIAHFRSVKRGVFPFVVLSQAVPIVAILPLLTIWFGFGITTKIIICAMITFAPIVINTVRGLQSFDRLLGEFMYTIDASGWERFYKMQLPTALPFLFAGTRIAVPLAMIGAVVGEFYNSDRGLGFLLQSSATQLLIDQLFVVVGLLAIIGVGLFGVINVLEHLVIRWEPEP